MDEVRQWQARPLEPLYPIVYVDCLMVNVRENQRVFKKALYLVLAIDLNGQKDAVSDVDRANGRCQVLAASVDRTAEPRGEGHFHCLRRWTHRLA